MKIPRVSSALKAVDLRQKPAPLIIGERLNTQGSKKAKEMVLRDDYDGLVDLARAQVEDGAHCLDVCVATTERSDELEFMRKLVKRLSLEVEAPLVIDSTDPKVIEASVVQVPGRPIINSINLEGDGSRFHALAPLMAKYGLPAVAMCIGPKGMAKSAEEKVETAQLLYDTGRQYGLQPWQFIYDVLTFTLATGEQEFADSAKNTLEGIRLVKEKFPESFTTLGLSNVSFGLPAGARKVVNSVFLYHAIKAGLDTVIINPRDIIAYTEIDDAQKKLAEDLIFNHHQNALAELIAFFENTRVSAGASKRIEVDPSWDAGKKCHFRILNRLKEGIEPDVVLAIADRIPAGAAIENGTVKADREAAHEAAVQTLNEVLLPAMKEVGDKFGAGELILPFVLKSAECMKAAVTELEKYLIKQEGVSKGKLVLCTVYGDVHDIGKNLVKTIFVNNGYTVFDLGKQVPLQKILEKIDEVKPDAIGLSALLVSTSKQMQYFIEHARQNDMKLPVLCGGAAINTNYINRIAKEGGIYNPGVFFCKTAFDGLRAMNALVSPLESGRFIGDWKAKLEKWSDRAEAVAEQAVLPHSGIVLASPPIPPHVGRQVRLEPADIDLAAVWKHISKKSLFVLQWGIRGKGASESDPEKLFDEWKRRVVDEKLLEPRAVYGYFKCSNLTPGKPGPGRIAVDISGKQVEFEFPRSSKEKHLCLADYFGPDDIVAFQAVTAGAKVTDMIEKWNKEDRYTDAYYLHGIAVETAEAMAEWVNARIRKEMGIGDKRGLRYSWGYPSCPDIMQHHQVWQILEPGKSGMTVTELGQIVPDQSTAAIVVHHPNAEYFVL